MTDTLSHAGEIRRAAVLGAGIMGGGIAFTSASHGIPVLMKDVVQKALDLGIAEAAKLLNKQVAGKRLSTDQAALILESIAPHLSYDGFDTVDIVVEAVVENVAAKQRVLAEVESHLHASCVLASNTSSLSIALLAKDLKRPENFAGMHFFNPVHVMPLVEVIRGPQTSSATAETLAAYAKAMGKTPIIVRDCPGFLVNRILTAYFVGFLLLIRDGADFRHIDRVMESFGWPMGPAYLQDVIGMDTSAHVIAFITGAYPAQMRIDFPHVINAMVTAGRHGQKNGVGFYRYMPDDKGRPLKQEDSDALSLAAACQPNGLRSFSDEEIIDRMMLPMVLESIRCLEEGIALSAADIDVGLTLGCGFPRQYGGPLKYADTRGLGAVIERAKRYVLLSAVYEPTPDMQRRALKGVGYRL